MWSRASTDMATGGQLAGAVGRPPGERASVARALVLRTSILRTAGCMASVVAALLLVACGSAPSKPKEAPSEPVEAAGGAGKPGATAPGQAGANAPGGASVPVTA